MGSCCFHVDVAEPPSFPPQDVAYVMNQAKVDYTTAVESLTKTKGDLLTAVFIADELGIIVRETGVDYETAKAALKRNDGDLVDAIFELEFGAQPA